MYMPDKTVATRKKIDSYDPYLKNITQMTLTYDLLTYIQN